MWYYVANERKAVRKMNDNQKSIKTSSKVISVIMKIGYIAMIVAMCICASSLIFIVATGGKTSVVTSGGIRIMAADASGTSPEGVAAICAAGLVVGAFLFAIFLLTYRMFNEISITGTPFNLKYVKTIKTIGVLVAVMTVVGGFVDSAAASYAGMETLGLITDSTGLVFGVIIFCLAYIFDYGCALQKQSDETL